MRSLERTVELTFKVRCRTTGILGILEFAFEKLYLATVQLPLFALPLMVDKKLLYMH